MAKKTKAPSDDELARAAVEGVLSNGIRSGPPLTGKRAGLQAAENAFDRALTTLANTRRKTGASE
jgi:hypothetical protein